MINTYDLKIYYHGTCVKSYINISRVAVKRFIDWHRENLNFTGYIKSDHAPHLIR